MEYKIKAYNIWEVGQKRDKDGKPRQEDALFPAYGRCTPADRVFVLCDGMGGHDNGEVASAVVCDTMSRSVLGQLRSGSGVFREGIFDTALRETYDALDAADTGAPRKMGTTMAFLCLYEKGYFMAHIGDTRIYHIRPGDDADSTQIMFATTDHSLVNKLVASGKMSEEEALASTRRHVITRALQPHMEVRPQADVEMSSDIRTGDYFVMCTHGMLDNLGDAAIKRIFSRRGGDDAAKLRQLRAATADNRDNHSAIVIHIEEVMSARAARRAASREATENMDAAPYGEERASRSHSKKKMQEKTRRIIQRAKSDGDLHRKISWFLFGLMAVMSLVMVAYYAFIREDEAMLEAGREQYAPVLQDEAEDSEEKYGYETKSTEVIDDRVVDDAEATDSLAAETPEAAPEEETAPETAPETTEPAEPAPAPEPATQPDMPILQE